MITLRAQGDWHMPQLVQALLVYSIERRGSRPKDRRGGDAVADTKPSQRAAGGVEDGSFTHLICGQAEATKRDALGAQQIGYPGF